MSLPSSSNQSAAVQYLSQRGIQHGLQPLFRYIDTFYKACTDLFHPIDNPNGIIIGTLSENCQMFEEIMRKLAERPLISYSQLKLGDHNGSPELRDGIRQLIVREISCNIKLVDDHILCLGGATGVMAASSCALFNPGESILILTPCYPGFLNDFPTTGDVHAVKVQLKHPTYEIDLDQLEEVYQESVTTGHQPRAIIVTNPANPTGLCPSKEKLTSLLRWVREKKLFYISSEVYGTACHQASPSDTDTQTSSSMRNEFVSIIDVAYEEARRASGDTAVDLSRVLGNDIQVIWSAAKDLGLSGLRVGASICQNPLVHAAMSAFGVASQISREAQYTVALLLNDKDWIQDHFSVMRSRLRQGCALTEALLERLNIPFVQPYGGLFIWFDFAEFLPLYYHKRTLKTSALLSSENASPSTASTGLSDSAAEKLLVTQEPTDDELNEAEWEMFQDGIFSYKLGLAPGLDFTPGRRSLEVSKSFLSAVGFPAMPTVWNTPAGFMRLCFGAVPLPFIPIALQRLENFIVQKRQEMKDLIDKSDCVVNGVEIKR